MYLGYCYTEVDGRYMPPVKLEDPSNVLGYCTLQHELFPEVRITDEWDFTVLRVVRHIMYCPMEDKTFRALDLRDGSVRELTLSQVEEETSATQDS